LKPDTTVLLVEDNQEQRELAELTLQECCDPQRVATAANAAEALDFLLGRGTHAARASHLQPRLVILSLPLAGSNDLQVLKSIRAHPPTRSVPVVAMLPGEAAQEEFDRCYQAGANSVVRKSADAGEQQRKLRHACEFWVKVNEADRNTRF
jgi:two-component system response regulator